MLAYAGLMCLDSAQFTYSTVGCIFSHVLIAGVLTMATMITVAP